MITHGSLFTGIGGFDLASEWMGWKNVFQCEIDDYCQKLLRQNFPNTKLYNDIKKFNAKRYENKISILTRGFPCQPFSIAGKRNGKADDRYLWHEMLRVIREVKPKIVVGENVTGIVSLALKEVLASLENEGYQTECFIIPACSINAPHRRDRVWIIAYANSIRTQDTQIEEFEKFGENKEWNIQAQELKGGNEQCRFNQSDNDNVSKKITTNTKSSGFEGTFEGQKKKQFGGRDTRFVQFTEEWNFTQPAVCGRNDGVSNRVDRLKGLGNAVLPQIPFELFKVINTIFDLNI